MITFEKIERKPGETGLGDFMSNSARKRVNSSHPLLAQIKSKFWEFRTQLSFSPDFDIEILELNSVP